MSAVTNPLFPGKAFIGTVLEALETKTAMSGTLGRRYLQRAAMAGILIAILYVMNYTLIAAFDAIEWPGSSLHNLGKVLGAAFFGFALVFIYYSKSELLTSNMMIVSIGAYHRRITWLRSARLLTMCYFGNFVGGAFIAVLLYFSTIADGAVGAELAHAVDVKLAYVSGGAAGMGDLFVRAILCNFMINLGMLLVYNGLIKEDLMKSIAMLASVFIFAFLGFEHSVANTALFAIVGLQQGIDVGLAVGNVAIAIAGNFVGGGLLIGLYYAYVNDDAKYLRKQGDSPE